MPPVEVPAIRSKSSETGFPVSDSILARTMAGMMPRIPPPSIDRILSSLATFLRFPDGFYHGVPGRPPLASQKPLSTSCAKLTLDLIVHANLRQTPGVPSTGPSTPKFAAFKSQRKP